MSGNKVSSSRVEFTGSLVLGGKTEAVSGAIEMRHELIDASSMDGEAYIPGRLSWSGRFQGFPSIAGEAMRAGSMPVLQLSDGREGKILVTEISGRGVLFQGSGALAARN